MSYTLHTDQCLLSRLSSRVEPQRLNYCMNEGSDLQFLCHVFSDLFRRALGTGNSSKSPMVET
jgi:hypothetical protein